MPKICNQSLEDIQIFITRSTDFAGTIASFLSEIPCDEDLNILAKVIANFWH